MENSMKEFFKNLLTKEEYELLVKVIENGGKLEED